MRGLLWKAALAAVTDQSEIGGGRVREGRRTVQGQARPDMILTSKLHHSQHDALARVESRAVLGGSYSAVQCMVVWRGHSRGLKAKVQCVGGGAA